MTPATDFLGQPPDLPADTQIVVVRQETGVTLDFPLRDDERLRVRRQAWQLFEIAVWLLLGSIIVFAISTRVVYPLLASSVALLMFVAGIILLILSANKSGNTWIDASFDDDLRQLAALGNMLVRTTRDQRKQIWYREEIDVIEAEEVVETRTGFLVVVARLRQGEKVVLASWQADDALSADRGRAEQQWVARQLRQALFDEHAQAQHGDAPKQHPLAQAIQKAPTASETQIKDS